MKAIIPWLLLIGVAWFGGCEYQKNRQLGADISALERRNAALENDAGRVDTVYDVDTVDLRGWRTRYDTARHELSINLTDKVKIEAFALIADSTIKACSKALQTCETRVAYRDSIIGVKDSIIALEKKRGTDWKTKLGWLLVGAAAGSLVPR
jgi:hypothetical protein